MVGGGQSGSSCGWRGLMSIGVSSPRWSLNSLAKERQRRDCRPLQDFASSRQTILEGNNGNFRAAPK